MTLKLTCAAFAMAAGIAAAFQAAANAGLSSRIGLGAALAVNTLIMAAGVLAFFLAQGPHANFVPAGTPWTLYLGGVCGFVIIAAMAFAFPKIGAAWAIAIMVLGQGLAALAIDHYGLMEMPQAPLSWTRALGLLLVGAGVVLMRR